MADTPEGFPPPRDIPDAAVKQEQANTDKSSGEMAGKENKAFSKASLKARLKNSKHQTSIMIEWIYRCAILFLFLICCAVIVYMLFELSSLVSAYFDDVKKNPVELKSFLHDIWKVLSGAAIVSMVQFLGWAVKNRRDGVSVDNTLDED